MDRIKLGSQMVGEGCAPFIIAEMSGNHKQSYACAIEIVRAAAKAGAHALKIQTYTPDTMTLNLKEGDFLISDKSSPWYGYSLYDLYKEAMTPYEWHKGIMEECKSLGLEFFSSPFDKTAVDFLEDLGVAFYKIASFENTDKDLIKYVASKRKPIIVSTGLTSISDINNIVNWIKEEGNEQIILLKCTSAYPALPCDANINTIENMKSVFKTIVGLSDHTLGIGVAIAAVAKGATVIEKHFTLDRSAGGVDSSFSMEPLEFKSLVTESQVAWESLGGVKYEKPTGKGGTNIFKRSLYISQNIKKGEVFSDKNIRSIRPGFGLPVEYSEIFFNKKASRDIAKGTALSWDMI